MFKKALLLTSASLLCLGSAVAYEQSATGSIKRLISYSDFGNGDVYISLEKNGTVCSYGYFISKSHPGYEANLSMLLAAYQSNRTITLYGKENEPKWPGSSSSVCELYSVEYKN